MGEFFLSLWTHSTRHQGVPLRKRRDHHVPKQCSYPQTAHHWSSRAVAIVYQRCRKIELYRTRMVPRRRREQILPQKGCLMDRTLFDRIVARECTNSSSFSIPTYTEHFRRFRPVRQNFEFKIGIRCPLYKHTTAVGRDVACVISEKKEEKIPSCRYRF